MGSEVWETLDLRFVLGSNSGLTNISYVTLHYSVFLGHNFLISKIEEIVVPFLGGLLWRSDILLCI